MPCRNGGRFLEPAVRSVLNQAECLELLVADGGSTDGSLQFLESLSHVDSRLRIVSTNDCGPADALNKAFRAARGTLIGWLNADDLMPPGSLARAVTALEANPEWLMVYGEGEEFNEETGLIQRYPTLPVTVGLEGFRSYCFICQPTVVFRRCMGVLLGPFDTYWRTAFDFDYWLRAFEAIPHRIGYIPHLQGRTRLHENTITSKQRSRADLEFIELVARHFGLAPLRRLHCLGIDLQLGLAETKPYQTHTELLRELVDQAAPWLDPKSLETFCHNWQLNAQLQARSSIFNPPSQSKPAAEDLLPLRLLQALYPRLHPQAPGSPVERESRWQQLIANSQNRYRLLNTDEVSPSAKSSIAGSHPRRWNRPFGVNLIGHAFEVFGIGEDIRMAARALQSAGVPCCVIHHPAENGAACTDRSLEPLLCSDPAGGPYAFNLVCMQAPIQARWLLQKGFDPLRERYTIASWPWETLRWPEVWDPLLEVVDEVWPSSTFTAQAFQASAAEADVPLQVMPMAAEITDPDRFCNPAARTATRQRYGLSAETVLFGYGFDLNSTAIRKNPMGALEAFQRAFPLPHLPATFGRECTSHPLSNQASLLIKTFPPQRFSAEWEWLQVRAAEDPRIVLIAESLPRDELLSLYGCCDVFLSLHRSEGFGRGMAEALQLGVDVIATDFGGNTDFLTGPLAYPVRWREAPIPRGSYPNADGHSWAEPDLDHAAQLCQKVASRRLAIVSNSNAVDPSRDALVMAEYRKCFAFENVGTRYKLRLQDIYSNIKD